MFAAKTGAHSLASGSHNATVTAWMNQVITNGGTVSAGRRTAMDTLFNAGVTNGWLTLLDYFAILAAENTQSALLDTIHLRTVVPNSAPTFTTDRGYTGNGTSSYLDSGFNPSTMGVNYTRNSASFGVYNRSNRTVAPVGVDYGSMGSDLSNLLYPMDNGTVTSSGINGTAAGTTCTTSQGMWLVDRSGAAADTVRLRAAAFASYTDASVAVVSRNFAILASNNPAAADFSIDQIAMAFAGGHMTVTQSNAFYNDFQAFATTVGFQV